MSVVLRSAPCTGMIESVLSLEIVLSLNNQLRVLGHATEEEEEDTCGAADSGDASRR